LDALRTHHHTRKSQVHKIFRLMPIKDAHFGGVSPCLVCVGAASPLIWDLGLSGLG